MPSASLAAASGEAVDLDEMGDTIMAILKQVHIRS
jgi:hypothetical protein